MSYFKHFPLINGYRLGNDSYLITDITRRTGFDFSGFEADRVSIEYSIKEGETPEIIADRMYDSADLYWIILMFNQIHDINEDWPLSQPSLDSYIEDTYTDPNAIHHYESIATGFVVDSDHVDYDRLPVTNAEFEYNLNESKRNIRLIDPDYVGYIKSQHKALIRGV